MNEMNLNDTIVSLVTGANSAPVAVIRISGPKVLWLKDKLKISDLVKNQCRLIHFCDDKEQQIDHGLAIYFQAPNSFTGDDVLEFQGHGNAIIIEQILEVLHGWGIRLAEPGEFSRRAFLNGKMDLTQAEAICDLINAGSRQVAQLAIRSLQGGFSDQIKALVEVLIDWRIQIEASIDFPEEGEVSDVASDRHRFFYDQFKHLLDKIFEQAQKGHCLRQTNQIAFVGPPNVGKSTWFNRLLAKERAIVTNIPGTTRDVITESCQIGGVVFTLADTAGIHSTDDTVEKIGIEKSFTTVEESDHLFIILDASRHCLSDLDDILSPLKLEDKSYQVIMNKADLIGKKSGWDASGVLWVSSQDRAADVLLEEAFNQYLGTDSVDLPFLARRRHLEQLEQTRILLHEVKMLLDIHPVDDIILGEYLRQIQDCLGKITGKVSVDDLLDRIFSQFCMGK